MESHFETENYQEFLNELHSVTSIDSRILDNLIKLNLIHYIFKNNSIEINQDHYSFTSIKLIENYQFKAPFILASYPLHNQNFNEFLYSPDLNRFKHQIIHNSEQQLTFISDSSTYSVADSKALCLCQYINMQSFSDHNILLLNYSERNNFENYITNLILEYYLNDIRFNNKNKSYFLISHLYMSNFYKMNHQQIFNLIDNKVKQEFEKHKLFIEKIKNNYRSQIDSYFERSLLENELELF